MGGDLMPRRVKKRRKIETEDGSDQGWEEYFDYIFPEDEAAKPNLKLLAMAKMWKKQKETVNDDPSEAQEKDADDQDIVNESSEESEDEDDGDGETERKKARLK